MKDENAYSDFEMFDISTITIWKISIVLKEILKLI